MWIVIAIVAAVVLTLALLVWRRTPPVADDVQRWKHGLDALGRTAGRPAADGTKPRPEYSEDSVRVLHPRKPGQNDDA